MKLKKGSLEAKRFMAKIRAKKGKAKKVSGVKKPSVKKTHTDIKSHNYKILISGIDRKKLSSDAISGLRSLAKASSIIWKMNGYGLNELKNRNKIGEARVLLLEVIMENGYTSTPQGKIIKTIH
jgi:hypothetical protein